MGRFKGSKGADIRKLPKSKPKKKPKRGKGNGWGLFGIAASVLASAAIAILRLSKQRKVDTSASRNALRHMLLRPLQITEHGACRMDCRHISKREVYGILEEGSVNQKKSNAAERPCPKYVIDAKLGFPVKNVQGVFSACPDATRLVTVIDKDTDWSCYCP